MLATESTLRTWCPVVCHGNDLLDTPERDVQGAPAFLFPIQPKSEEDPADFTTCHLGLSFRARYNALIGVRVVVDRFLLKVVGVVN